MTEKKFKESFKILPVEDIIPSRTNPRKEFNQLKLNELAESIKSNGVIQPVIVRKNGEPKNKYELVSGERRLKASRLAGLEEIPAIIKDLTDEQVWEIQIIENLQRVDIHPLHEAEGFKRVIDSGKYTKELLAAKVGKSRSYISQRIKLNDLTVEAKNKFYEGKILLGHALIIAKLQEKDQKEVLSWRITNTSVEELENTVKQRFLSRIADAPFNPEDQGLAPEMGKCSACYMRSGFDPSLFPELKEDDYCTFRKCYDEKIIGSY
ncbi:MAG: ParB/RepB/Spo0J family partition protein [Ignavibacteriae bacterium]|nr:ParB/RepB/Spo0J family partition protein [Ignavibacteriota bacterium]